MLPSSDNIFLSEILDSVRKRRRAILNKVSHFSCNKVIEESGLGIRERLELEFKLKQGGQLTTLGVFVWDDRWIWLHARASKAKKRIWNWTFEGRFLRQSGEKAFITAVEKSLEATYKLSQEEVGNLTDVWVGILSRAPKAVIPLKE